MENKNIVSILIIVICIVLIYYVFSDKKSEKYIDPSQLPIEAITAMLGTIQSIVDTDGIVNVSKIFTTSDVNVGGKLMAKNITIVSPNIFTIVNTANNTNMVEDSLIFWKSGPAELVIVGRKTDNSDYSWPGIVLNGRTHSITLGGAKLTPGMVNKLISLYGAI